MRERKPLKKLEYSSKAAPVPDGPFTDESIMPFGKHKGVALGNVPGDYLLYMYNEGMFLGRLKIYVEENMQAILREGTKLQRR